MPAKASKTIDWVLYLLVLLLIIVGILVIYSISYDSSGGNIFRDQIIFAIIGTIMMVIFTFLDYRSLKGLSIYLYLIGLVLLVLVYIFGKVTGGASRWLDLKFIQLQPSEIFKFILIITMASYLSNHQRDFSFRHFIASLLIIVMPIILVLIQPDFGTALILLIIGLSMLLASQIKKIYLFLLVILIAIFTPLTWFFILKDYQKIRLITFLNPKDDPFGAGYNVLQSSITVGSGMLYGRGFGKGFQSQLKFLPASHTDFIFAVFAEEFGFIGALIIILFFVILVIKIIQIAKIAADNFGMLFTVGVATLFIFQVLINIGMNIGIMPVTGIPLPFISSGGSALITNMVLIGILQSIIIRHKKLNFG
ncbi:MAG TPA: rod shape-determining protein RodA [Patescibacteria group bacterium]|nr:rod shape-determining protein RodA [Patescibacteria group bacterium]